MKSFQDLNAWSAQLIEYEDLRPSGVTIDRDSPTNQSINFNENQSHTLPLGLIVTDIQNSDIANLTYTINLSSITGDSNVDWGILPTALTATEPSPNVFTLSGFQLASQWTDVAEPSIQIPFGVFGEFSYTASINYVVNNVTPVTKSWTVNISVAEVEYLSTPALTRFYSNTTVNPDNALITVDTGEFDPVWTMVVVPNPVTPVQSLTYAESGSVSYDPTSRVLVATGNKAQVNSVLNSLSVVFNNTDVNTNLFYTLSNNLNSTVDQVVGVFRNQNLRAAVSSTASLRADTFGATMRNRVTLGVAAEFFDRLRADDFYSRFTNTITAPRIGNFAFNPVWTVTVTPSTALAVSSIQSSGTGGTVSYNPLTGVYTITGNRTVVNSYLDTLTVTVPNYETNFTLTYRVTNDQNALEGVYVQSLTWVQQIQGLRNTRYYLTNGVNNPLTFFNTLSLVDTSLDREPAVATPQGDAVYIRSDIAKFGQSLYLGTSSGGQSNLYFYDQLIVPSSSDFTIEFWINLSNISKNTRIISSFDPTAPGNSHYSLNWSTSNGFVFTATGLNMTSGTSGLNSNTWYHVAVSRSGNNFRMLVNGTTRSTGTAAPIFAFQPTKVGSAGSTDTLFDGTFHIDELRISKIARYTAGFTPATAPFVNDANTLALFHMDGAPNSTEVNDDNTNSGFRLRLTVGAGDWGTDGQTTVDWSGTRDSINSQIVGAVYYPPSNSVADHTLRIEYFYNGQLRIDYTATLRRWAQADTVENLYVFNNTSDVPITGTWTPTRIEKLYSDMDFLVVGGGGGASTDIGNGGSNGGGGGAVIFQNNNRITAGSYAYIVGNGGRSQAGAFEPLAGESSQFGDLIAAGGSPAINCPPTDGVNPTGWGDYSGEGGDSGSGFSGGLAAFAYVAGYGYGGGGGGGATGPGSAADYPTQFAIPKGGPGGPGLTVNINGTETMYGAGGHGYNYQGFTSGNPPVPVAAGSGGTRVRTDGVQNGTDGWGKNGIVIVKTRTRIPRELNNATNGLVSGAVINTGIKRFGIGSLDTTSTNTSTVVNLTDVIAFGTADFTIEAWVRITQDFSTTDTTVWSFMANSTDSLNMRLTVGSTQNRFIFRAAGANRITSDADWALDTWYHVAIVRSSSVTRMYVNGIEQSTTYTDVNNYPARIMNIARVGYASTRAMPGQIDELRISSSARYTSNFTPATEQFQNDSNTLALLHMDTMYLDGSGDFRIIPDDNS